MNISNFNRLRALQADNLRVGQQMDALRPRFERLRDRHLNGAAPRAVSAFNLFQTPVEIAQEVARLADARPGMTVLEPSAGLGRLLDALPQGLKVTAVEVAKECAGELYQQDRQGVTILQRDFLTLTPAETGLFDRVVMNPPFHMRADIRHILHARTFLAPGGRLVAVCMNTHHRKANLHDFAWHPLPARAFRREGTGVDTAIVTFSQP